MEDLKKKIREEITTLEYELRNELPKEILKARAHGDLRENAEFHAAKERQRIVDARLAKLYALLSELSLIDLDRIPRDRVGLGSTVVVLDLDKEQEVTYKLVHSELVDPNKGHISTGSPIGKILLGKKAGDEVSLPVPGGKRTLEILKLTTIHES
jgi:transcription elongation factor GreA